jgi:D-glycero-alpha-D-manno-heptose-7-phosphate kinase
VHASAPIRICDIGGWTDTWFAGHGAVFNIAVTPRVEAHIEVHPVGQRAHRVTLDLPGAGERYSFDPPQLPGRNVLLEETLDEIGQPDDVATTIRIESGVPAGISTGTSAAVTVALIGALDLVADRTPPRTPYEVASTAHRIETERLGAESGVQDQLCASYGGINYIEISSYPESRVTPLSMADAVWDELEHRLVLVSLGRSHVSSDVHRRVIARLRVEGPASAELENLRRAARQARAAANEGDLERLGRAMVESTEAQRKLHPGLVSADAQHVIDVAADLGASGWKVNGAGGDGGSLTLLCGPGSGSREELLDALTLGTLTSADAVFEPIPIRLSRQGLRVWEDKD